MKLVLKFTIFSLFLLGFSQGVFAEGLQTYVVDTSNTVISWNGKKKVGDDHQGVLSLKNGRIEVLAGKPVKGEFIIDMNSIKNTDLKGETDRKKLEGHLKSPDFFDVENHTESKFVFTTVKDLGNNRYALNGKLTIRGIPQPKTLEVSLTEEGELLKAAGKFGFDRTKYGVMYKAEDTKAGFFTRLFKGGADKVINNVVDLEVKLSAKKQ